MGNTIGDNDDIMFVRQESPRYGRPKPRKDYYDFNIASFMCAGIKLSDDEIRRLRIAYSIIQRVYNKV